MERLKFVQFEKKASFAVSMACGSSSIFLHDHDFIEIVFVDNGCALHEIDGNTQCIGKGDLFIVPPGHAHRIRPNGQDKTFESQFRIYNVLIDISRLPLDVSEHLGVVYNTCADENIKSLIRLINNEYVLMRPGCEEVCVNLLQALMRMIERIGTRNSLTKVNDLNNCSNYVHETVQYLNDNFKRKLMLDDIASTVGLSKGYLQRLFKAETGKTITYSIVSLRVQYACMLLLSTKLNVCDVSSQAGFTDINQFHVVFKRFTGLTPKAYRSQNGVFVKY